MSSLSNAINNHSTKSDQPTITVDPPLRNRAELLKKCIRCSDTCSGTHCQDRYLNTNIAMHSQHDNSNRLTSKTSKKNLHVCEYCFRTFPFKVALQMHLKDHAIPSVYKCSDCSAHYPTKYQLSVHVRKHTNRPYQCKDCNVIFINPSNLHRHIRNAVCQKRVIVNASNTQESVKNNKTNNNLVANNCVISSSYAENHKFCHECNELFATEEDYSNHKDLHKTGNIFKCKKCSKNFCTLPKLCGSILEDDESYWLNKCMLCGDSCVSHDDWITHLRKHVDNNEDLYCKECQKSGNNSVVPNKDCENSSLLAISGVSSNNTSDTSPALTSVDNRHDTVCNTQTTSIDNRWSYLRIDQNQAITTTIVDQMQIPTLPFNGFPASYITATNINDLVGPFYHQQINGQQRFLQSVCNVLPALPLISSSSAAVIGESDKSSLINAPVFDSSLINQTNIVMVNSAKTVDTIPSLPIQIYPCAQIIPNIQLQNLSAASFFMSNQWSS